MSVYIYYSNSDWLTEWVKKCTRNNCNKENVRHTTSSMSELEKKTMMYDFVRLFRFPWKCFVLGFVFCGASLSLFFLSSLYFRRMLLYSFFFFHSHSILIKCTLQFYFMIYMCFFFFLGCIIFLNWVLIDDYWLFSLSKKVNKKSEFADQRKKKTFNHFDCTLVLSSLTNDVDYSSSSKLAISIELIFCVSIEEMAKMISHQCISAKFNENINGIESKLAHIMHNRNYRCRSFRCHNRKIWNAYAPFLFPAAAERSTCKYIGSNAICVSALALFTTGNSSEKSLSIYWLFFSLFKFPDWTVRTQNKMDDVRCRENRRLLS